MVNKERNDYDIGYKKPPTATRFKKGQSGNPTGRRKKDFEVLNPGKSLQLLDNEEIAVFIDGKVRRLRKGEVHFRQLFTKAIKGDLAAARLIAKMAAVYFGPEAERPSEIRFKIMPDEWWDAKYSRRESA